MDRYQKMRTGLLGYLKGKGFHGVISNFYFAERLHSALRKDGVTPEFFHQMSMVSYARNIKFANVDLAALFNAILGHDAFEDYDQLLPNGPAFETVLSKTGKKTEFYYSELSTVVITAVVKGVDRVHNLSSMVGVFTIEKQRQYVEETLLHVIPMLDRARRNFPEEDAAFRMLKHNLLLMTDMWTGINTHEQA